MRYLAMFVVLVACTPLPDTVGEAAPSRTVWQLETINDTPVTFDATLRLLAGGGVRGTGPCNAFTAEQIAPLPWVEFRNIAATRRACPELEGEARFLTALEAMDFAEVAADSLLLSNDRGESLFFRAR